MIMKFDKILTVDESFLDVSLSYTFNDAVIFYHALFEMQNTGNMGVYIRFEDLKQYFTTEDIKILEYIKSFIATAPVKPVLIGSFKTRKIIFPVKYGFLDINNGEIFVQFDDSIKTYIFDVSNPAKINLDILKKFKGRTDKRPYEVVTYQNLAHAINRFTLSDDFLYVPYGLENLLFKSSVFNIFSKESLQRYQTGKPIKDLFTLLPEEHKLKNPRYLWKNFRQTFMYPFIRNCNKNSDVFIENICSVTVGNSTKGVIFKIKNNSPDVDYYGDIRKEMTQEEKQWNDECKYYYESKKGQ